MKSQQSCSSLWQQHSLYILSFRREHDIRNVRLQSFCPASVLLYHSICKEASGENQYTISTERFESDLIWLKDHGFTSVSASQLIGYVENGSPLPSKPVLITFDDGYMNNYSLAFLFCRNIT